MADEKKFKVIQGGGEPSTLFGVQPTSYELWKGTTPAKPLTMKSLLGALEFLACDTCLWNLETGQDWYINSQYCRMTGQPAPEPPKRRHCNRHDKFKLIDGEKNG